MNKIVIFASGSGTNAERICRYFENHKNISVVQILSNKANAGVLRRAENLGVPSYVFTRSEFYETDSIVQRLKELETDLIVLAGFLWLIPPVMIKAFPGKIVNIHPALLPDYGGKGMYGMRVHEAVIAAKEKESGITIHFVNENYDEGQIIFQARTGLSEGESPQSLANKIHELEYKHFPVVIEELLD